VADDGTVWATNHTEGLLNRIDPETNEIVEEIVVADDADDDLAGVAVVGDTVWVVMPSSAQLVPIEAATGQVGEPMDASTLNHPYELIADGDRLVVTEDTGGWAVLEPPSLEELDSFYRPGGDSTYTLFDGQVWQASRRDEVVYPPPSSDG
jgi:hypothetical protein